MPASIRSLSPLLAALGACTGTAPDDSAAPDTVAWSGALAPLAAEIGRVRGYVPLRAILHLHSPWSHDACDGDGLIEGEPNAPCLADLRRGLCEAAIDVAFLTDHPAYAADQGWERLLLQQPGDTDLTKGAAVIGNQFTCEASPFAPAGRTVAWLPGIEDELMPVALDAHAGTDLADADRLYNKADGESIAAEQAVGGTVLMAHTEGKPLAQLEALQDAGLQGIEIFNLHAMFAPDKRQEDLGLDPYQWLVDIAPFTRDDSTAEPDLFFLGVLQEQAPSLQRYDALLARGPMIGMAGTDAHQNVMPLALRDGERGDSYRRMFRWFGNVLLATDTSPAAAQAALDAGRLYVAFHVLGTPDGFDFSLTSGDGTVYEMGSDAPAGTITVGCPVLAATSPRGRMSPEITATVFKDGAVWQTGCGAFETDGPGAYRVRVDLVPHHLTPFLGEDPDPWIRAYPWVYGNAIRVGG